MCRHRLANERPLVLAGMHWLGPVPGPWSIEVSSISKPVSQILWLILWFAGSFCCPASSAREEERRSADGSHISELLIRRQLMLFQSAPC